MLNLNVIVNRMQRRYFFSGSRDSTLRKIWINNACWAALALLLWLAGFFPRWIEEYYSRGLYIKIAHFQRIVTKLLPFSLGDLLYAWWIIAVLLVILRFIVTLLRGRFSWPVFWLKTSRHAGTLLRIYVLFYLLWGLNYSRLGIAYQLQLSPKPYSTAELTGLTTELLQKVNTARKTLGDAHYQYPSYKNIFDAASLAYDQAEDRFPFLGYRHNSIKRSLYSSALTALGYTGYYNPFSGEAQVNTIVPAFYLPYVTCHEVAHQLGYGDESEANFVGYLAASASDDPVFHYSAYLDLFNYANGELFLRDTAVARANYRSLDTLVRADLQAARLFFMQYRSRMEPLVKFFYGQYLKANHQPRGVDTYDEVTGWLIAFRKKYGQL